MGMACETDILGQGNTERWELRVVDEATGKPVINHCDQSFGQPGTAEYALVKGRSYTYRLFHAGTNRPEGPDYDWLFLINDSDASGILQGLYGTGIFIVEDPDFLMNILFNGDIFNFAKDKWGKIYVPGIITETVATDPPDRTRKTIGVGEEVKLTLLPNALFAGKSIVWEKDTASGELENSNNPVITFTAPDRETHTTITAKHQGVAVASVTLHTIEPDNLLFENRLSADIFGAAPPKANYLGLEYMADVYLQPATVNFGMITVLEGYAVTQTEPGYFRDYPPNAHPQWKDPFSLENGKSSWVAGKGTLIHFTQGGDFPGGATENVYQCPLRDGYAWWDLPWMFRVGENGAFKTFKMVKQDFRVIGAGTDGLFRVTKGASGAEIKTGDDEAYFITP